MCRPIPAQIFANALASSPVQVRTQLVMSNWPTIKAERVRSAYRRILIKFSQMQRENPWAFDRRHPQLVQAHSLAKSRLARLDYKELIGLPSSLPSPSEIDEWYKEVADVDRLSAFCGIPMHRAPSLKSNEVYKQAAARGLTRRAEQMAFRIQEELTKPGYPVFWTLTVDPEHEHIIAPRREEFKVWLRKVRRHFGTFSYCCVVERGAEGRLHYHCLFRFDDLSRLTDPNWNRPAGKQAEIPELRGFWPYGLSNPVAVRYNPADSYGRLGWRWPRGRKSGSPQAVALYMAKYLTKATDEVDGCRTKMSRNFGLQRLQMTLPDMV